MAVEIVETDIDPQSSNLVEITSRYAESEVIYYGNNRVVTFKTYKREIIAESDNDLFLTITPGEEFRPDLVSNRVYGVSSFGWLLMQFNKIKDVFDFRAGVNLRIPPNPLISTLTSDPTTLAQRRVLTNNQFFDVGG